MVDRSVIDALPVFRLLTQQERVALAQIVTSAQYQHGDVLFFPGDARTTFFVILSGDVAITSTFYKKEETIVVYHEHDFISLLSLFPEPSAHRNRAQVTSASAQILLLQNAELVGLTAHYPAFMEHLLVATSAAAEHRLTMANRKLFTFYSISRILRLAPSLFEVASQILTIAMTATDATRSLLLLRENVMGRVMLAGAIGFNDVSTLRAQESSFERDPLVGSVFANKTSLVVRQIERRWASIPYATSSMLLVPLVAGERVLGVLVLADRSSGRPFLDNSVLLVEAIAQQLVDAAERGRLTQQQEAAQHLKRTYVGPYGSG